MINVKIIYFSVSAEKGEIQNSIKFFVFLEIFFNKNQPYHSDEERKIFIHGCASCWPLKTKEHDITHQSQLEFRIFSFSPLLVFSDYP